MRKLTILLLGVLLIAALPVGVVGVPAQSHPGASSIEQYEVEDEILERTLRVQGTEYTLRVNTSNHTVRVNARHFGENQTNARYVVTLNEQNVISEEWTAERGETRQSNATLIYQYNALERVRNVTLHTFHGSAEVTYNFTVPRQYKGKYLRPSITDITFERLNRSHGEITVTVRSDSKYYYPRYYQVWTQGVVAEYLNVDREIGQNVTTASMVIPVKKGEPFEGEIRAHSGWLNETGPLHSQWEFYGYPGDAQFSRVPYEPMRLERVTEHTYVNESDAVGGSGAGVSDALFRKALGGAGIVLVLMVVLGVVVGRRSRV